MRTCFEPGDGTFEVILDKDEPIPQVYNVLGVCILRELAPNVFRVVKDYDETLTGLEPV